ncbi:MAG: hypothetical protein ACKO96_08330, partial [Flammeovirgaceae bacterium]
MGQLPPTIASGKRAGLCVIEVCSSLFIFISVDKARAFICPPATSQPLWVMPPDIPQSCLAPADGHVPTHMQGKPTLGDRPDAHWHICLPRKAMRHQSKQKSQPLQTLMKDLKKSKIKNMESLVIINILATLIGSGWLIYMVKHQRQVIKDQSEKLNELEKYTTLFKQLTQIIEPDNVLKLLETKKKLMEQENEEFRRRLISDTNNKLGKEWGAVLERQIIPKYNDIIKE